MDLAKQKTFDSNLKGRFISGLFLLPGVWLIYYLLAVKPNTTIVDFQEYRNKFYGLFVAISVVVGFIILVRKGSAVSFKNNAPADNFHSIIYYAIPGIIQGIILVTFSYAIAKFIQELFNYF